MNRTRRIEITVERRRLVWPNATPPAPVFCPSCPAPVVLLTPEEAAALAGVSVRAVYRWVETGQMHYLETSDNQLFVCPSSFPPLIEASLKGATL
ncbi:MAG: helix-turn-helix domain-containing protein [Acidobacteria bacterium]|nr:helix-turn-helix domain-containing protein [Acidobacteriota bacterium]MBI3422046.1 helix-turn-helix domain-containing protein [Acidobacteriota bacterium]